MLVGRFRAQLDSKLNMVRFACLEAIGKRGRHVCFLDGMCVGARTALQQGDIFSLAVLQTFPL